MIPPRPNKITQPRHLTLVVHCTNCGQGRILASGYNATEMPRAKQFQIMLAMGWDCAPKYLCRGCACPMEWWRKQKANEIYAAGIGKGVNFALALCKSQTKESLPGMDDKIDKWFATIDKD